MSQFKRSDEGPIAWMAAKLGRTPVPARLPPGKEKQLHTPLKLLANSCSSSQNYLRLIILVASSTHLHAASFSVSETFNSL